MRVLEANDRKLMSEGYLSSPPSVTRPELPTNHPLSPNDNVRNNTQSSQNFHGNDIGDVNSGSQNSELNDFTRNNTISSPRNDLSEVELDFENDELSASTKPADNIFADGNGNNNQQILYGMYLVNM